MKKELEYIIYISEYVSHFVRLTWKKRHFSDLGNEAPLMSLELKSGKKTLSLNSCPPSAYSNLSQQGG